MQLHIENIGKIKNSTVELNGITLICGENNTGKSTVGKVLFCIFDSCYMMNENILVQLGFKIEKELNIIIRNNCNYSYDETVSNAGKRFWKTNELYCFTDLITLVPDNIDEGMNILKDFLCRNLHSHIIQGLNMDQALKEMFEFFREVKNQPMIGYKKSRIRNIFNTVFCEQFINVSSDYAGISACIQSKKLEVSFNRESCENLLLDFEFTNKALFIDAPDKFKKSSSDFLDEGNLTGIKLADLCHKFSLKETNDIDRTEFEQNTLIVSKVLNKALDGKIVNGSDDGFKFENVDVPIKIGNLSTGVKALLLFKTICEKGLLSKRDVLILDEPEIHMHPEWQVIYAEAIVLLQKELELTVLITSHSPMFVRAIECYCDYYDRMNILDVYRTYRTDDYNYDLENISYRECGVSELYDDFSRPYSALDDLLAQKYDD